MNFLRGRIRNPDLVTPTSFPRSKVYLGFLPLCFFLRSFCSYYTTRGRKRFRSWSLFSSLVTNLYRIVHVLSPWQIPNVDAKETKKLHLEYFSIHICLKIIFIETFHATFKFLERYASRVGKILTVEVKNNLAKLLSNNLLIAPNCRDTWKADQP